MVVVIVMCCRVSLLKLARVRVCRLLRFWSHMCQAIMNAVSIPVIASSGAGAPEHFSDVFEATDVQAVRTLHSQL